MITSYAELREEYATIRDEYANRYLVPGPFATLADIREEHRSRGGHYFDTDTCRFFQARYVDTIYAGRVFIDSVKMYGGQREYRAKVLALSGTCVETVRDHMGEPLEGATLDGVRRRLLATLKDAGYTHPPTWHDRTPPCIAHAFRLVESLRTIPGVDIRDGDGFQNVGNYDDRGNATFSVSFHDGDAPTYAWVKVTEVEQGITLRREGIEQATTMPIVAGVHDFVTAIMRARADIYTTANRAGLSSGAPNGAA